MHLKTHTVAHRCLLILALVFALGAGSTTQVFAQEDESAHHAHRNHISVFVGATTPTTAKGDTSFALGADYERRLTDLVGIIGLGDFTFGDHERAALFAGQVAFHFSRLRLAVGPGFELAEEVHAVPTSTGGADGTHSAHFIVRGSVLYEFHAGDWVIGPMLSVDAIGETKTNIVYGLSIGRGF